MLTKIRKLLTTRAALATVEDSEGKFFSEEQIHFPLLKHIVKLDCAEGLRDGIWDSHKNDNVLVLAGFWRLHQLVIVLLGDGVDRICHLITLEDCKPNLLRVIRLQRKTNNRKASAVQVCIDETDGNLDNVFVSQFASFHARSVSGRARTRGIAVSTAKNSHWARVSRTGTTGVHFA